MHTLSSFSTSRIVRLAVIGGLGLLVSGCKEKEGGGKGAAESGIIQPSLRNSLGGNPSTFLADQAEAPIHWQIWSKETFEIARRSNRMIFAVLALPQHSETQRVLRTLYDTPDVVDGINTNFVPVLVDSDAYRETGLIAAALCRENKMAFALPVFAWFTADGNPVGLVAATGDQNSLQEMFRQTLTVTTRMWAENRDYVLSNSSENNSLRLKQMLKTSSAGPEESKDPAGDSIRAIRQLATYYDAGGAKGASFDSAGNVLPFPALELLARASRFGSFPEDAATKVRQAANGVSRLLSQSPNIDPLDGGVFSVRQGFGWTLMMPARDCQTHARGISAFSEAAGVSGDAVLNEQVIAAIGFAEKHYAAPGGLFALGRQISNPLGAWLWRLEDVERNLSPDEAKVWKAVAGLTAAGNIAYEADPAQKFLNLNSLRMKQSPEAAASSLGMSPDEVRVLFESGKKKLLQARQSRISQGEMDIRPHAASTFRMISAYASAYQLTKDPALKKKAVETLAKARAAFASGAEIQFFAGERDKTATGRAFLYGIAIQAALDVYDISLETDAKSWAWDLAVTAAEKFMKETSLREVEESQSLIPIPVSDRVMIYDDASAGLFACAAARLDRLGLAVPPVYQTAVTGFPVAAVQVPFVFTHAVEASLVSEWGSTVLLASDASDDLKDAVCSLPLRVVARRVAEAADEVPSGKAKILFADGTSRLVSTPGEMKASAILAGGTSR